VMFGVCTRQNGGPVSKRQFLYEFRSELYVTFSCEVGRFDRSKKASAFCYRSFRTTGRALIYLKDSGEKKTEVRLSVVSCVMRSACCLTSRRDTAGCSAINLFTRICAIIATIRITPAG
jgi:hypothetical protein